MHNTQELLNFFQENKYTCVIANNGEIVYTSFDKGVKPLVDFYKSRMWADMNDLQLIDKVIGKGAAFLCKLIGIKRIHTEVISQPALDALREFEIQATYETLTEYIINADKTGHCPVETLSEKYTTPESFYPALLDFFSKKGKNQNMLKIAVIDAQGGGFGKALVEALTVLGDQVDILALGTNVFATMAMRKAGAHRYATGENAICFNADKVDIIMGGVGILAANSMLGEITQQMANSIASSHARKIVIPFGKCNITVPGTTEYTLKELVTMSVEVVRKLLEETDG